MVDHELSIIVGDQLTSGESQIEQVIGYYVETIHVSKLCALVFCRELR